MAWQEIAIDKTTSGDTTVVAAISDYRIRVFGWFLVATGDLNFKFKSGSTALTGPIPLYAGGSQAALRDQEPWFTLGQGEALVLNSDAAVQLSGRVYYTQVK